MSEENMVIEGRTTPIDEYIQLRDRLEDLRKRAVEDLLAKRKSLNLQIEDVEAKLMAVGWRDGDGAPVLVEPLTENRGMRLSAANGRRKNKKST